MPDYKVITNGIVLPRKSVKGSLSQESGGGIDFVNKSAKYDLKQIDS